MFVKRIFAIIVVIFIIMACVPMSVYAVDPVSTATMANALAQAITAYGASHGVSMSFDVTSTDGIGEGMHELWDDFKDYVNDNNVPTYDSLANTMWATIYTKVGNYIGININDTEMPFIDAFWNWLLSGPAEMSKVDNQYYEWTLNNQGTVSPIFVYSQTLYSLNGIALASLPASYSYDNYYNGTYSYTDTITRSSNIPGGICFIQDSTNPNYYKIWPFWESNTNVTYFSDLVRSNGYTSSQNINVTYHVGNIYYWPNNSITVNGNAPNSTRNFDHGNIPIYVGIADDYTSVFGDITNSTVESLQNGLSVKPYIGDTVPQDVYIPDNEDVNYAPLPYIGGIDIPWDDSLFGDGTGTLTDAQSEAISGVIDNSITDSLEKTLTLADTDNPDLPAPNEVYIPFLPVSLPSFNFSLSGIWHYVREWLSSLGAWFTMVLTIWGNLPYAIVVPVYATMVILIVLGVYKRFFM